MCIKILPVCMSVHCVHSVPENEEAIGHTETGVRKVYELLCGHREPNLGPLQE